MNQLFIGIDPGLKGGLAVLDSVGNVKVVQNMPVKASSRIDEDSLFAFLRLFAGSLLWIALEKSQAMPKQGISSAFNYGFGSGTINGICKAVNPSRYVMVGPKTWQKTIWTDAGSDQRLETKQRTLQAIERLFPHANLKASERCKKPHEGIVDALGIAEWLRRTSK